jgi:formate/nitrite transporter FocA (FNT family)
LPDEKREEEESIAALVGIFTAAWALVLIGTVLIFKGIVPLNIFHSFLDSIVKGVLAAILVGIWLLLFLEMRNALVKIQLRLEKKVATS